MIQCRSVSLLHVRKDSASCVCTATAQTITPLTCAYHAALVLLARFLLQNDFLQRRGSLFLLVLVAALVIAVQAKLAPRARCDRLLNLRSFDALRVSVPSR